MTTKKPPHKMPSDFLKAINSNPKIKKSWEGITPLAKNEFMCWVLDAKQKETRDKRIKRACEDLLNGKRRPCCWMGCTHRKDKPISPSQKFVLSKKSRN